MRNRTQKSDRLRKTCSRYFLAHRPLIRLLVRKRSAACNYQFHTAPFTLEQPPENIDHQIYPFRGRNSADRYDYSLLHVRTAGDEIIRFNAVMHDNAFFCPKAKTLGRRRYHGIDECGQHTQSKRYRFVRIPRYKFFMIQLAPWGDQDSILRILMAENAINLWYQTVRQSEKIDYLPEPVLAALLPERIHQ